LISEWEFEKLPWRGQNNTRAKLRHRLDAGYWPETSSKDWWLFGGKGFDKQYSDLWKFHGNTLQWERIYPKSDPILRAMVAPDKIPQPIICGHHTSGRTVLAVYGPTLHTDTVWLYEVNDTLWTSYVCCCEKDTTNHAFCPDFTHSKQSPVAWCDSTNGALLSVVPTSNSLQLWRFSLLTTRWEHVSLQSSTPTTVKTKFNCNITDEENLLYTSADGLLYIICPSLTDEAKLKRLIYRYPNANGEIEPLGSINLNLIPTKISVFATRTSKGKTYLILGYQQLVDIWLLDDINNNWVFIENIWKGNALKWFQAISSNSGIYYLNLDGSYIMLPNPKLSEQKLEGVIQEQGIFNINISEDDGSILRGDYINMKKMDSTIEITTETPISSTIIIQTTTENVQVSTTTEWSAEIIMEGSSENISTCCWNFTETIVGNDRALLALTPQVNEVARPIQAIPQSNTDNNIKNDKFGALMFFAASLSLFAIGGVAIFIKRCVRWPSQRNTSTILKEPPPIRYSVIPDELTYPTYPGA
jgi:hypothetical protein